MYQRGEMNQLDHGTEGNRARGVAARRLVAQQQERGPKQLSFHLQEMLVHFADDGEIGGDHAAQLRYNLLELVGHGPLNVAQTDTGNLLAHVTSLWRAP